MPRANRYFLPGYVWHITHRCHEKKFLLKFARDRVRYLHWLFEAKKRFGLCILDYMVTSNHVHLLVKDTAENVIAESMQLIAGRTAQEYNERKGRHGAFWEDRYHATAIQADDHLKRCLVYIDLNMVRAGVVNHPAKWKESGFNEIQQPPKRYATIDPDSLAELSRFSDRREFQRAHREWIEQGLESERQSRDEMWSAGIAVGSLGFVRDVKGQLGLKAAKRELVKTNGGYTLRDPAEAYTGFLGGRNETLNEENRILWDENLDHLGR